MGFNTDAILNYTLLAEVNMLGIVIGAVVSVHIVCLPREVLHPEISILSYLGFYLLYLWYLRINLFPLMYSLNPIY